MMMVMAPTMTVFLCGDDGTNTGVIRDDGGVVGDDDGDGADDDSGNNHAGSVGLQNSLEQLKKAIKGFVVMSEELDKVFSAFLNNQVPIG